MKKNLLLLVICLTPLLAVLLTPKPSVAGSITVARVSDSIYAVQGNDFLGISGADVTIQYDPAAVSNPRVSLGSLAGGALMAANASTPGTVRFSLVRVLEMNGSGPIATLSFTRIKNTGADIRSVSGSLLSGSGRTEQVPSQVEFNSTGAEADGQNESVPLVEAGPEGSTAASGVFASLPAAGSATAAGAAAGTTGIGITVVPVPAPSEEKTVSAGTEQPAPEVQQQEGGTSSGRDPVRTAKAQAPAGKAPEPEKKRVMAQQSVLEKFREYKGRKTPEALISLFRAGSSFLQQDPPLVLSDGKTSVKVIVDLDPKGENNNFLLEGVTLVSLRNREKNEWIVELVPDARTWEASIIIPRNNQLNIMPLAVAPAMDVNIDRSSAKLDEKDFRLFLKERGTPKVPRFDLNNDGNRDYVDDYIFTANYIFQHKGTAVRKKNN